MRKKRRSSKTIYIAIAIAGLLSLLGMALIGANSAIHTAERTAERTQQYLREQCISYQDIIAADRVKSLVRLTEQVQELTDRDRLKGRERSNEGLAEYAQQQRISCVLVLNDALEPVYSYGVDMDWSDLYTNESVSDVMQYPEKIFARRLTRDGVVYDVAAAARTVEPGMVFCVRRQSSAVIASYYASVERLLAGYETLLNERIYTYITDGEKIIGSSDNGQWNLPVDSVPLITALEHERFTGDPLYMRQICQNIIGNAIKYNHPGGWVRCSFRESRDADGVCRLKFVCEDNGVGMSETFQRHMFEAFAQENSDRGSLSGGVGMGLAVVKKLVDERGGTIQVDSARGQGTRFCVVLPMMPSEAEPEAALPDAAAFIAGRRLLVAEDNELNREIAVYLLQEAGAMVDQAADGKEAVEMFAASAPGTYDAVLMDVMMPELDGLSATRAIRGMDRPDAQLPIIAMTANLFDEDVAAFLAAGMDAHIPKPLEAGQMIKTIAEWLERKKQ